MGIIKATFNAIGGGFADQWQEVLEADRMDGTTVFTKGVKVRTDKRNNNKKGNDVKVIAVAEKTVIADYFVLATGNTSTHVRALADEVEFKLKTEDGIEPLRVEGAGSGSWVLIDYGSVIVHVFGVQSKEFYKLEKLWSEGTEVAFDKIED